MSIGVPSRPSGMADPELRCLCTRTQLMPLETSPAYPCAASLEAMRCASAAAAATWSYMYPRTSTYNIMYTYTCVIIYR